MKKQAPASPLEMWAGVECTVNRVGDVYFSQLERNGHDRRVDDIDRFAALGIRAIRYPVLWERTAPDGLHRADWSWADERLARLRAVGLRPIVGLVHHGSGPRHTSLLDPGFAEGLAEYARAVAERYPWVEDYTPVNEPLTTARFSGLYGHWYPHGRDDRSFVRALLTECRATALAMRAIREVNPRARLVQTEDFGRSASTPLLAYQAEYENHRRWLSLDLLTGRIDREHPLYSYLTEAGATPEELEELRRAPCPPDIIGINYYITSERLLDERLERYPACYHGGNDRHAYADIEAVRVRAEGMGGHLAALLEVHRRYGRPMAITEAHLGGPREEQLRWLLESWRAAELARAQGARVAAVTAWSLLGAYDWDSLLVRVRDSYESGVFDMRGGAPRPTALAKLVLALARGGRFDHPVVAVPGWWRRNERLLYAPVPAQTPGADSVIVRRSIEAMRPDPKAPPARPLVITGARGTLGRAFARICAIRGIPYRILGRQDMDIADPRAVESALDAIAPWAIINAAGYVRVDEAEQEPKRVFRENTRGPSVLAAACRERDIRLVTFSSDLVFDGAKSVPYVEKDGVAPLGIYGRSKAEAERRVLQRCPSALVVRTSAFFGPWDDSNFVTLALRALRNGDPFRAAEDAIVSPTYVPDLVHATLDLLIDGEHGLWHLANRGALSWADLAERSASLAGLSAARLIRCPSRALGLAPRPLYSALGSERAHLLPPLEASLERYMAENDRGQARDRAA